MIVRTFHFFDYDAVIALWQRAGIQVSQSDSVERLRHKLERDPELFLVAIHEEQIVGAVMGSYDGRRGWVNHLAVDPSYQGNQLGKIIMAELEKRFKSIGCEKVNLLIERDNEAVQGFYEKNGFASDDLIFMEKWIR
ncbi:GNAT family acetyltransferase [Brevibacillus fluminis]|uniref:GNAT family acetyltransferase n=1 Tax=Brevibacillus fluminis TaxID=511487 RepID=A0A3M8DXQ7_9BACL|nr:GNAT family acetyltransferase [Brevibacillus fluminis]RNB92309.1 GNAT family acetyltransferase [Brevibacillus fluminis]